jgi:hypothetical protein
MKKRDKETENIRLEILELNKKIKEEIKKSDDDLRKANALFFL